MEFSIKDLITNKISGEWGKDITTEKGVKVIRTTNFTNLGVIDLKNIVYRDIDSNKIRQKKLLKGDIIIEKSGGSPTQPVGRVVFFDLENDEEYLCNNFTTILRPDRTKVYPKYLFHILFIGHLRGMTLKYQNKTTGIINLKLDNYLNEVIKVPSIVDQVKIVQTLSKIESFISKRKICIKLIDDFLKSTFFEFFGNPVQNEKKWNTEKLNKLTKVGTGGTPSRTRETEFYNGDINWAKTTEVNGSYIFKTEEKITELALKESNCKIYPVHTILLAMYGQGKTRGNVGYLKIQAATNQACAAILPSENINQIFLFELLKNSYDYLRSLARGGSQENLNLAIVGNVNIILPPKDLQNTFENIVLKSENLKKHFQDSLNEFENLYKTLGQEAYKGALDISKVIIEEEYHNFAGNEPEEQDPIKRKKIKKYFENEIKKIEKGVYDYLDQPNLENFDIDEEIAISKGAKFYAEWQKLHLKEAKSKLTWDKVSTQQIAEWVKAKYDGYHFSNEMLIRFLMKEHVTFADYYSSEELKKFPYLNGSDDLKSFVFSAVNKENPFIKFDQIFYDAEKENVELKVLEEDFELIKNRDKQERSGIYFSIVQ